MVGRQNIEYLGPIMTSSFMICPYFKGIALLGVSHESLCFLPVLLFFGEHLTSIFDFLAFGNCQILCLIFQTLISCSLLGFMKSCLTHVQLRGQQMPQRDIACIVWNYFYRVPFYVGSFPSCYGFLSGTETSFVSQ